MQALSDRGNIKWLVCMQAGKHTLFDFNPKTYNRYIHYFTKFLGITDVQYTSHSARHGGASHDLQRYGMAAIEHIRYRGRWKSSDSVELYTQGAARAAQQQPLPPAITHMYDTLCETYGDKLIQLIRSRSCVNLRFT